MNVKIGASVLASSLFAAALAQAPKADFLRKTTGPQNSPAVVVSNDKLELTVVLKGGAFATLIRKEDPEKLSPLWAPKFRGDGPSPMYLGHFVCIDGFGPPSMDEHEAGATQHGEAHSQHWQIAASAKQGDTATVTLKTRLPNAHEVFTRTVRLVDGESIVRVHSVVESELAFDRPLSWTEHATIGAPFLELGATVLDLPAKRAMTRPSFERSSGAQGERRSRADGEGRRTREGDAKGGERGESPATRYVPGKEFTWPKAPMADGTEMDMRNGPATLPAVGIITVLLDDTRQFVYITALNTRRHLLFGYILKAADYPWMQDWHSYADAATMARGMEFGMQPFGMPRRDLVQMNTLLGAPTYRWLPAKSKVETSFLMFYTPAPEQMRGVSNVKFENNQLIFDDQASSTRVSLAAARLF